MKLTTAILALSFLAPTIALASAESRAQKVLDANLIMHHKAVRWNDFEAARDSVAPDAPTDSAEDAEGYYKEFQVVSYKVKSATQTAPFVYQQRVEIGVMSVNTQTVKSVIDRQVWRYDETAKRWWLTTGLPKLD